MKLIGFVPVLLLVAAVNIAMDPQAVLPLGADPAGSDERRYASLLADGFNVSFNRPINDRLLFKYWIEHLSSAPDIMVLGSSNTSWIGENIFAPDKVLNHSLLGAVLADYMGLVQEYEQKNMLPKKIIFVLNAQLVLSPDMPPDWLFIKQDVYGMMDRLGVSREEIRGPLIPPSWQRILSFHRFQMAVDRWMQRNDEKMFFKDGRYLWDRAYYLRDVPQSRRAAVRDMDHGPASPLMRQLKFSRNLEDILEKFVGYLTSRHVQVTCYVPPFHPILYHYFLDPQRNPGALDLAGIENDFRALARRLNVKIKGSFNSEVCGLDEKDFYDESHVRNEVLERMLKQEGNPCSLN